MSDSSRRDRCNEVLELWRRSRRRASELSPDEVRSETRALLEHALQAGCRAELLEAAAAYRTIDDFVRALLSDHPTGAVAFRLARPADDAVIAEHYLAVWRSYGTPEDHFVADARERTLKFLETARHRFEGGCVVAERNRAIVGSAGYQIQVPQFPEVLRSDVRKVGYIWSVYVEPAARRQGVAGSMVERAVAALKASGCMTVVLHASDAGAPLYARLGFSAGPEMRLKLRDADA